MCSIHNGYILPSEIASQFCDHDDIAIWSVIMKTIIIIIVIVLCRVKIFEWSNFCDNRIIVYAFLFKFLFWYLCNLFLFSSILENNPINIEYRPLPCLLGVVWLCICQNISRILLKEMMYGSYIIWAASACSIYSGHDRRKD